MKQLASLLAYWIVRRPMFLLAGAIALVLGAAGVLTVRQNFDTDILNLLPAANPAVQGLKIYNRDFTQTRELAFLLTWKQPPADIEYYRTAFAQLLRQQPWVVRILDTPPLEDTGHPGQATGILVPLLLNLPPDLFREAMRNMESPAIQKRIERLSSQMTSGSLRARFELENDPLGVAAIAARPVWESIPLSETFNLVALEGDALIMPVITNQKDLSAESCEQMMKNVRAFIHEAQRQLGAGGPEIGVTGRTPYVEEISQSMQRDIMTTSLVSLMMVVALFWIGFRRIVPLIGITLILALTALAAMAIGVTIFNQLNIIAISFCSILFGLGDDFSLLLCQHYYQARTNGADRNKAIETSIRHCLPGMLWVALTTGVGFLALSFSGSAGFAQLGVLVAVGVLLCAVFMPLFLFPFLGQTAPSKAANVGPAAWLAVQCTRNPHRIFIASLASFACFAAIAIMPWQPLHFDISPSSLEPRNTPAARTLADMMKRFPATFEPVMVVVTQPDSQKLSALNRSLADLKKDGLIESFSSPSGLFLDPDRIRMNSANLRHWDSQKTASAVEDATFAAGLNKLEVATRLISSLEAQSSQEKISQWSDFLPVTSAWWFLLDRMVAPDSSSVIAYLKIPSGLQPHDRARLETAIREAVPEALVTGWSQTLAGLIPWAKKELLVFGAAVGVLVFAILWLVYRDHRFWLLHVLSILGALAGTAATLKLLNLNINLLNVLAFPLMLGVGVDYGTHLILSAKEGAENLAGTIKAVTLSGLTTATGFGALVLAQNPSLSGLGAICSIGVLWCLASSLLIVVPGMASIPRLARKHRAG